MKAGSAPEVDAWMNNRPVRRVEQLRRWLPRWRSAIIKGTERGLAGRNPWDWLITGFETTHHLAAVRDSVERVELLEDAQLLDPIAYPSDVDLPHAKESRPPISLVRLRDVRCHLQSGLIRLAAGYVYFGSDGGMQMGLLRGGAAQEVSELRRAGERLHGTWAVIPATQYFYHHLIDHCIPTLKAMRAEPGLRVAVPTGQANWYYDVLTTLNIPWTATAARVVAVDRLVHVDRGLVTEEDVALLRSRVEPVPNEASGVLLLSRRGLPRFDPAFEQRVQRGLDGLRVSIVDPSVMSFAEQIFTFASASFIVGPHGASLANLVWSRHCRGLFELFGSAYRGVEFARLARATGTPYWPLHSEAVDEVGALIRQSMNGE